MLNENGSDLVMPVSPMYGGNGGFGFGGDWGSLIVLFLIAAMFGGGFGGFGGGFGGNQLGYDFPWLMNGQQGINNNVSDGFRDQMVQNGITSIRDGIGDISTQLCNGFANVEIGANARQLADMQQSFASQTAITGAITDLARQQADCCCENRLATCQTQNIVQNEGNATRFADANNTRDIITNQTANTQAILDKLCQLELDGVKAQVEAKNDRIAELQTQLNMATLRESQTAQNAFISQGFANEVDQLYNRLSSCPVGTVPVAGSTPLFSCNPSFNGNGGCGCGQF